MREGHEWPNDLNCTQDDLNPTALLSRQPNQPDAQERIDGRRGCGSSGSRNRRVLVDV